MKNDSFINIVCLVSVLILVPALTCLGMKVNVANDKPALITAVSTFFIALFTIFAVFISYQLYELNKRQSVLQMNQAFNTINQLILSNPEVRKLANKYAYTECKEAGCGEEPVCENQELLRKSFLFSVLNIYEAYYIQNRDKFTGKFLTDTILKNLLTHNYVITLIKKNNFDAAFKEFSNKQHECLKKDRCKCA